MKPGELATAAVIVISAGYLLISFAQEKPHAHVNVVEQSKQCQLVNTILTHTMEAMAADRAYLFQFHNGIHGIGDKNFFFYSNTHEVTAKGVSAEIMNLQRLPISILAPTWMPQMAEKRAWFLLVKNEPHAQTRYILEAQGIKALAIARVIHLGHIVGFVGVDYTKFVPENPDLRQLKEAAGLIQPVIMK